jgi:hypothetical protein
MRNYKNNKATIHGLLDDYVYYFSIYRIVSGYF